MATIVIMPKQGLMMEEGTITSWLKKEGEAVTAGEPLFEMETDKLTITKELDTYNLQLAQNSTVTLNPGTAMGENANITDKTGTELKRPPKMPRSLCPSRLPATSAL